MDSSSAAIAAKVRVLYGRMLTQQNWERLCRCTSVSELAAALRMLPAWQQAMEQVPAGEVSTAQLVRALHDQAADEHVRIFRFASLQDKQYLLFAAYKYECSLILANLRRLLGRSPRPDLYAGHDFFLENCRVDVVCLNRCGDWTELCRAAERSIYAGTLRTMPLAENGLPRYPDADTLLESRYYAAVFAFLEKKYGGPHRKRLIEYIGTQADFLNLTHLMRLKHFYPQTLSKLEGLLIPVRHRLTGAAVQAIVSAPDPDAAYRALEELGWSRYISAGDLVPERAYDEAMIRFCRRLLSCPEAGICTAQAYLTLKEIECRRLIRVIEAVRLGVESRKVL